MKFARALIIVMLLVCMVIFSLPVASACDGTDWQQGEKTVLHATDPRPILPPPPPPPPDND